MRNNVHMTWPTTMLKCSSWSSITSLLMEHNTSVWLGVFVIHRQWNWLERNQDRKSLDCHYYIQCPYALVTPVRNVLKDLNGSRPTCKTLSGLPSTPCIWNRTSVSTSLINVFKQSRDTSHQCTSWPLMSSGILKNYVTCNLSVVHLLQPNHLPDHPSCKFENRWHPQNLKIINWQTNKI